MQMRRVLGVGRNLRQQCGRGVACDYACPSLSADARRVFDGDDECAWECMSGYFLGGDGATCCELGTEVWSSASGACVTCGSSVLTCSVGEYPACTAAGAVCVPCENPPVSNGGYSSPGVTCSVECDGGYRGVGDVLCLEEQAVSEVFLGYAYYSASGSGTWVRPAAVTRIKVTAVGGGGSGGSYTIHGVQCVGRVHTVYAGMVVRALYSLLLAACVRMFLLCSAGGGSGASSISWYDVVGESSITFTVGSGGPANSAEGCSNCGLNGESTTFMSMVAGGGSRPLLWAVGGLGGTCSGTHDLCIRGRAGSSGDFGSIYSGCVLRGAFCNGMQKYAQFTVVAQGSLSLCSGGTGGDSTLGPGGQGGTFYGPCSGGMAGGGGGGQHGSQIGVNSGGDGVVLIEMYKAA